MALITKREFHHEGNTYFLQLNTNDSCLRIYRNSNPPEFVLLLDNDLDVYDSKGKLVGNLCINDDVVQGFINGVRVADDFELYSAMAQFGYAYLKSLSEPAWVEGRVESSDAFKEIEKYKLIRPETGDSRRIKELELQLATVVEAYNLLEAKYLALTKPKYDSAKITAELITTALGVAYYGNALYVAKDIPGLTEDDRQVILRYLEGTNSGTDHVKLQDIANRIMKMRGGCHARL